MKTKAETAEVACIVGRFQVPELHSEHKKLIQSVLENHPRVLIFLGLSPCKCTFNNPLDFQTRRAMINETFPQVEVYYVEDRCSNEIWSKDLDKQIDRQVGPGKKVVLYGARDSFIPLYCGKYPCIELMPEVVVSGKEIRKLVGVKSKNTPEFRAGVIWAVENMYPHVVTTVDIAILDFKNRKVGLARKEDETLLRFVGGHSMTNTPSFEMDAVTETKEETSGIEVGKMEYIGSTLIDDWRRRQEIDKIKTMFFACEYLFGAPKANDDIAEFHWKDIDKLERYMIVEEHRVLFDMLMDYLKKIAPTPIK
jgi:bifunctional NMN adenylyltransferase/nudix hydrolase